MWEVLQSSSPSADSSAHPHWSKETQLCTMQHVIQSSFNSEEASAHPHWREETQVHTMPLFSQSSYSSEKTYHNSHWRKKSINASNNATIQAIVLALWENHILTHIAGENSQRCTVCHFSCIQSSNLKTHMKKTHTGDKRLQSNPARTQQALNDNVCTYFIL